MPFPRWCCSLQPAASAPPEPGRPRPEQQQQQQQPFRRKGHKQICSLQGMLQRCRAISAKACGLHSRSLGVRQPQHEGGHMMNRRGVNAGHVHVLSATVPIQVQRFQWSSLGVLVGVSLCCRQCPPTRKMQTSSQVKTGSFQIREALHALQRSRRGGSKRAATAPRSMCVSSASLSLSTSCSSRAATLSFATTAPVRTAAKEPASAQFVVLTLFLCCQGDSQKTTCDLRLQQTCEWRSCKSESTSTSIPN
mmetsp:Transcript_122857/g.319482  ORF Transcript_122857/g.319482 Transcript_122857/m.319482 type:complete len:250 (+) Transcript_122857:53-802(+)